MNVLLTCAGRRSYLVRYFKEALHGRGQVIACDCSPGAPGLRDADRAIVLPRRDEPGYLDTLLSTCREHAARLLITVADLELEELARTSARFRAVGTIPVVAPLTTIAACRDKWAAFHLLRSLDIPTPLTFLSLDDTRRAETIGVATIYQSVDWVEN